MTRRIAGCAAGLDRAEREVRFWRQTGRHLLDLSFSACDPKRTSSDQHSHIETLWNIGRLDHCGWMPANLITLAHFSVSSAMSLPKPAGETTSGVPPKSASRACSLGSARLALISLLSRSTISAGVAFGAPTPNQPVAS